MLLSPHMRFDFITIFPEMFDSYLNESILKRATEKKLVSFEAHDLRKWSTDKHKTVDDSPYGGGAGMVMKVEPIYNALKDIKIEKLRNRKTEKQKNRGTRVILLSAKGKQFTQKDAIRLAKNYNQIIFICGRYEGVDERVAKYLVDEEISTGPYVLTGGELPAMTIADAISRNIPGVLGKEESLEDESHGTPGKKAHPQYTRPEIFKTKNGEEWEVPKILLSGDHKKIEEWRMKNSK